MPTFEAPHHFLREFGKLTPHQQAAFRASVAQMVDDLRAGRAFRPGLRVKRVQRSRGELWEMTWAGDGRATFHYGQEKHPGVQHIVWHHIGTHDILDRR